MAGLTSLSLSRFQGLITGPTVRLFNTQHPQIWQIRVIDNCRHTTAYIPSEVFLWNYIVPTL